jgi:hypothetical protein
MGAVAPKINKQTLSAGIPHPSSFKITMYFVWRYVTAEKTL